MSKPSDRISAVEWNVVKTATVVTLHGDVAQPVRIAVTGGGDAPDALHLVIAADAGTHADVVVEHHGMARLAEGVEIVTGRDSHLSTTFIQEWEKGSKHVGGHRIHVGENASLRHSMVTPRRRMWSASVWTRTSAVRRATFNMLGIYFADPGEHIEHRTMVVHNHPDCKSRVVYKGALDGQGAHSTWVGQRA